MVAFKTDFIKKTLKRVLVKWLVAFCFALYWILTD